jgi:hypothetical protein
MKPISSTGDVLVLIVVANATLMKVLFQRHFLSHLVLTSVPWFSRKNKSMHFQRIILEKGLRRSGDLRHAPNAVGWSDGGPSRVACYCFFQRYFCDACMQHGYRLSP